MDTLFKLCSSTGVSGFEFEIAKYVKELFSEFCEHTEGDALGNVIGIMNNGEKFNVMLEAHLDEIGLMVKSIDENGFIKFTEIGGVNIATLPGAEVYIHGKERVYGVIGSKPPHLQQRNENKKNYKIDDLFIDTGYNFDELTKMLRIGDAITYKVSPDMLMDNKFTSKSIDNRMGIFVLYECLKRLKDKKIGCQVTALASVQEEVGCRGAKVGAYNINPDIAIVVDVTHGTSPYTNKSEGFDLGSGAIIGVGPNLHHGLSQKIINIAKNNNIPYEIEVCAGNSGTNAWPIQISKKGIPCILLSVPQRYMHTSVETVKIDDIKTVIDVICTFIQEL